MRLNLQPDADDSQPFLGSAPPYWAARGIAYVLILLFAAAAAALIFVTVPETVVSRFMLVPRRGVDPVRSLRDGIVERVPVVEGSQVRKAQEIFVLQSQPVAGFTADLRDVEAELKGASDSLANARSRYEREASADAEHQRQLQARLAALERQIALKTRQLATQQDIADRNKRNLDAGLISPVDYDKISLDLQRTQMDLQQAEAERVDTQASLDVLGHEIDARRVEFQETQRALEEQAARARIRVAPIQQALTNGSGGELTVRAPCDGTIVRLAVRSVGAIVREGDVLSEIACADDHLQAELFVPQAGMARLQVGQGAKLLFDAFPYQRYGIGHSEIRWISPTADDSHGGAFRVLADVDEKSLTVNGTPRTLMAGMAGRADIVVGRRSLIGYVFAPIRQLRENMAGTPARQGP